MLLLRGMAIVKHNTITILYIGNSITYRGMARVIYIYE